MIERNRPGQHYEQEGERLVDLIRTTADAAITTVRFVYRGEVAPQLVPIDEAESLRKQEKDAATRLVTPLLATLLHPNVIDLFRQHKYFSGRGGETHISNGNVIIFSTLAVFPEFFDTLREHCYASLSFPLEGDDPAVIFRISSPRISNHGSSSHEEYIRKKFEHFKKRVTDTFPGNEEWVFHEEVSIPPGGRMTERKDFLTATRTFEPADVGNYPGFLSRFLNGSKALFELANRTTASRTIPRTERERLEGVIDSCAQAAELILTEISQK